MPRNPCSPAGNTPGNDVAHVHVRRSKSRPIKCRRHLHVPFTPCSRKIATRGLSREMKARMMSCVDLEAQLRMQSRVIGVEDAVVFLLCAFGIVAQLLHLISRFRPGAMEVDARLRKYRFIVAQKTDLILVIDPANDEADVPQDRVPLKYPALPYAASVFIWITAPNSSLNSTHRSAPGILRPTLPAATLDRPRRWQTYRNTTDRDLR